MYHINTRSKYCAWNYTGGPVPSVQFKDMAEVKGWLRRKDKDNIALYGISKKTAVNITRSLVSGGRRYIEVINNAHRDLVG